MLQTQLRGWPIYRITDMYNSHRQLRPLHKTRDFDIQDSSTTPIMYPVLFNESESTFTKNLIFKTTTFNATFLDCLAYFPILARIILEICILIHHFSSQAVYIWRGILNYSEISYIYKNVKSSNRSFFFEFHQNFINATLQFNSREISRYDVCKTKSNTNFDFCGSRDREWLGEAWNKVITWMRLEKLSRVNTFFIDEPLSPTMPLTRLRSVSRYGDIDTSMYLARWSTGIAHTMNHWLTIHSCLFINLII